MAELRRTAAAVGCVVALFGLGCAPGLPPERIVLVVVDTLRRDQLGCYGAERPTPHIDALAERGQCFANAFASFHQTSMSMASLFTGRTPSIEFGTLGRPLAWNGETWCGLQRYAEATGECVPPSVPTLASSLRDAGYWTVGIASNQFLYEPSGFSRGFDDWVEVGARPPGSGDIERLKIPGVRASRHWAHVDAATREALARRPSDQFFLYVHYMDVHDHGFESASYADKVAAVDTAVGRLLRGLEDDGLLENTTLIVTSDHGERLQEEHAVRGRPGHVGNPSFSEVLAIPLVVAPPSGRDPEALIRTEDIHRLIREIAGVDTGEPSTLGSDELLLGELSFRTYQRGRFKSSIRRDSGKALLFDLESDPGERVDVSELHPGILAAHRERVEALSLELSARHAVLDRISPADRERLRVLGYGE